METNAVVKRFTLNSTRNSISKRKNKSTDEHTHAPCNQRGSRTLSRSESTFRRVSSCPELRQYFMDKAERYNEPSIHRQIKQVSRNSKKQLQFPGADGRNRTHVQYHTENDPGTKHMTAIDHQTKFPSGFRSSTQFTHNEDDTQESRDQHESGSNRKHIRKDESEKMANSFDISEGKEKNESVFNYSEESGMGSSLESGSRDSKSEFIDENTNSNHVRVSERKDFKRNLQTNLGGRSEVDDVISTKASPPSPQIRATASTANLQRANFSSQTVLQVPMNRRRSSWSPSEEKARHRQLYSYEESIESEDKIDCDGIPFSAGHRPDHVYHAAGDLPCVDERRGRNVKLYKAISYQPEGVRKSGKSIKKSESYDSYLPPMNRAPPMRVGGESFYIMPPSGYRLIPQDQGSSFGRNEATSGLSPKNMVSKTVFDGLASELVRVRTEKDQFKQFIKQFIPKLEEHLRDLLMEKESLEMRLNEHSRETERVQVQANEHCRRAEKEHFLLRDKEKSLEEEKKRVEHLNNKLKEGQKTIVELQLEIKTINEEMYQYIKELDQKAKINIELDRIVKDERGRYERDVRKLKQAHEKLKSRIDSAWKPRLEYPESP